MNSKEIIIKRLKEIAAANRGRLKFNNSVRNEWKLLGEGAFRLVFGQGNYVFKIRKCRDGGSSFTKKEIDSSNLLEYKNYDRLGNSAKAISEFLMRPEYFKLPNGHDVVIMKKAKVLRKVFDNKTLEYEDKWYKANPILSKQIKLIRGTFNDSHDGNIGIISNRAFVIDLNMEEYDIPEEMTKKAITLLRKLKVKF